MSTRGTQSKSNFKTLLAVALVAVAGATAGLAHAGPGGHHGGGMMMGGDGRHGPGGMMGGHMVERMLGRVNATPEQREQIKKIMESARNDLRTQREASRGLHLRAMEVFTQANVDANAAESVRQQMLAQHDQASKRMTQAMVEASRVLTPEQRKQLAEQMGKRRDMMERHRRERDSMDKPRS